ncbi:MAG: ankyrin repeat domain-containing protein [Verrucomicrobiota bacterium]
MEEPYRTIQDIGQATERLAADHEASPDQKFAEAQKQLNRLANVKFGNFSVPVDWEQYIASAEVTLHHIQAEVRPQLDRNQATQIAIKTQAELNWDKVSASEVSRDQQRQRKHKLKMRTVTTVAVLFILCLVGFVGFYQWSVLTSNEGWFHDLSKKRWAFLEKRMRFGKSIETQDHMGMTGFLYLARTGAIEDLKKMQQLGADIHAQDNAGRTAMHHAAANANSLSVEWLVAQGLNINATDKAGTTPLHYFFQKAPGTPSGINTLQYLLAQGAKTDVANDSESLLMAAVLWVRGGAFDEKPAEIIQQLIDKGAKVNHRGANGSTALDNAMVKYLPKTPNPAILTRSDPVIKILLDNGATYEEQSLSLFDDLGSDEEQRIEFSPGL